MAESYLVVARIVSPQGHRGEVKAEIITDFPERFDSTRSVHVGPDHRRYELEGARFQDGAVVLKLRGIDDMNRALELKGALVEVPEEEAVELPPDSYFWHQIIGLRVVTVEGESIGTVEEILETGSNDVYLVRRPGGELLIPAIKQVVKGIDLDQGTLTIEMMPGLED